MADYGQMFPENSLFLVTGGAGKTGVFVCEQLLKAGYRVRALDDLSTGEMANAERLITYPEYEFIYGDIKQYDICSESVEGANYIIHLASYVSVPESVRMPLKYAGNNVMGTLNVLDGARRNDIANFVYVAGPEGEPASPFALSMRQAEEWAKRYTVQYGVPTVGVRIPAGTANEAVFDGIMKACAAGGTAPGTVIDL